MVVNAELGLSLLNMVGVSGVSRWLDILMTGMSIGGSTKPIHDLIVLITERKELAKGEAR
jgi:hypothetical protein